MLRSRLFPRSMLSVAWMLVVTALPAGAWQSDRPFRDAVKALNPVLYWPMHDDATSPTAEDVAGNNNGTHQGSPQLPVRGDYPFTRDDGDASVAYNIDPATGQSTVVSQPITTMRQPPITLMVLMRSTNGTQSSCVFTYGRADPDPVVANANYRIEINAGAPAMSANGANGFARISGPDLVCDGPLHMITAVFESQTSMKLYVDRQLVAEDDAIPNLGLSTDSPREVSVARYIDDLGTNNFDDEFEGNVAHCVIFHSALTANDVADLYRKFRPARFFDLVQEQSGDSDRAGARRLNQSWAILPPMEPGVYDPNQWGRNIPSAAPLHSRKFFFLDLERVNHNQHPDHTYYVADVEGVGPEFDVSLQEPAPTLLEPTVEVGIPGNVIGDPPVERFEVVAVSNGSPPVLTLKQITNLSPGELQTGQELFLYRYDYEADLDFNRSVAQEWMNRTGYDADDLFGVDGPPTPNLDSIPQMTDDWYSDWSPFFEPGNSIDLSDIISGPLYFRLNWGNVANPLNKWKTRARAWRDTIEHYWPEYATKPKFPLDRTPRRRERRQQAVASRTYDTST